VRVSHPPLSMVAGERMSRGASKTGSPNGNDPELWNKLLELLDEKLQLALLDRLRRTHAYQFESETLILEAGTEDDETYLRKPSTLQQLALFAEDATGVTEVKVKNRST
jgi:hypothetical protein